MENGFQKSLWATQHWISSTLWSVPRIYISNYKKATKSYRQLFNCIFCWAKEKKKINPNISQELRIDIQLHGLSFYLNSEWLPKWIQVTCMPMWTMWTYQTISKTTFACKAQTTHATQVKRENFGLGKCTKHTHREREKGRVALW